MEERDPVIGAAVLRTDKDFEIRPVGETDLAQILDVYRQCGDFLALGPDPHASAAIILKDLRLSQEQGGVFCGLYDLAGELVGVVDYVPADFEGDRSQAFLELLMIAAPHRRRGLGAQVVWAVETLIQADPQVKSIAAAVQVNNPQALRFWQRNGYTIVSDPQKQPDGTVCWRLLKHFGKANYAPYGVREKDSPP